MLNNNGTALAQGRPLPKRFGVFFWGNGVRLDRWVPTSEGGGYALSPALAPLQPVRDYCNVVTNHEVKAAGPRGHHDGVSGMLSGVEFHALDPGNSNYSSEFDGPSIDNLVRADLGLSAPGLHVNTATEIVTGEGPTLQFLSHLGRGQFNVPKRSPASIYAELFTGFHAPDETDPRNALRVSVLDLVKDDIDRLTPQLTPSDRERLDAHLTGLAELRTRILQLPPELTGSCSIPEPVLVDDAGLAEMADLQASLIAMAFACDLRQVATMQFTGSVGGTRFPGQTAGHHDLTHDGSEAAQNAVHATTVFTMQCFSSVMQKMAALPEGAGNVLDNSLWLATSDTAEGLTHSVEDYPIVLCGRAGGAMRYPGVHVRGPSLLKRNTSDVLMTILRAMGSSRGSIGTGFTSSSRVVSEVLA